MAELRIAMPIAGPAPLMSVPDHEVQVSMKTLEFWFEFGSTYSYLSAMRIDALAGTYGISTKWMPFLLGPIFKSFGWHTSPFEIYKQKGDYMWRDVERRASRFGLPFRPLDKGAGQVFPQNSLLAARIAIVGLRADWGRDFCRGVYHAQFAESRNIADPDLLFELAQRSGAKSEELSAAVGDENKAVLRAKTEQAMSLGIFGAPSFVVGEELFGETTDLKMHFCLQRGRVSKGLRTSVLG